MKTIEKQTDPVMVPVEGGGESKCSFTWEEAIEIAHTWGYFPVQAISIVPEMDTTESMFRVVMKNGEIKFCPTITEQGFYADMGIDVNDFPLQSRKVPEIVDDFRIVSEQIITEKW